MHKCSIFYSKAIREFWLDCIVLKSFHNVHRIIQMVQIFPATTKDSDFEKFSKIEMRPDLLKRLEFFVDVKSMRDKTFLLTITCHNKDKSKEVLICEVSEKDYTVRKNT